MGAVDKDELARRAVALIPPEIRNTVAAATLDIALVSGSTQRILRPVEIEATTLSDAMLQSALFGPDQIFERTLRNQAEMVEGALIIRQERSAWIRLDEQGSLLLRLTVDDTNRRASAQPWTWAA